MTLPLRRKFLFDPWQKDDSLHAKSVKQDFDLDPTSELQTKCYLLMRWKRHQVLLLLLLFISAYFYDLNPHRPLKNFPRVFTSLSSTLHPFFWVKWPYLHLYYPYLSITYPYHSTSLGDTGSHRLFLPQGNPIHSESFCVSETSQFGQCMHQTRHFAPWCCCCSAFESLKKIICNISR